MSDRLTVTLTQGAGLSKGPKGGREIFASSEEDFARRDVLLTNQHRIPAAQSLPTTPSNMQLNLARFTPRAHYLNAPETANFAKRRAAVAATIRGLLIGLAFAAQGACAEDSGASGELKATPYRPTVSNPADLPVPRHIEWEAGGLTTHDPYGERSGSVPYLLKYAFNEDFGVLVGGDSFLSDRADGHTDTGWGDTNVVAKFHHALSESTGLGLEASAKLPTATADLGSRHADYTMNGIVSTEVSGCDVDLNASYTRLGVADPGTKRGVLGWAVAASHDMGERWGVAGELSGDQQDGVRSATQFLAALSYAAEPTLVFDGGALAGLNRGASHYGLFAGLTMLLR
jgi:hypothetical protein